MRAVSLKEESGVLKPEYDPEQLRLWQEENGYTASRESNAQIGSEAGPSTADPSEITRPQTSPHFTPRRTGYENDDANDHIAFARRGSLATAHSINHATVSTEPRAQEVLTPVPIPFFNHNTQDPYAPHNQGPPAFDYGSAGQRSHPRYRMRVPDDSYNRPPRSGPGSDSRGWAMGQGW